MVAAVTHRLDGHDVRKIQRAYFCSESKLADVAGAQPTVRVAYGEHRINFRDAAAVVFNNDLVSIELDLHGISVASSFAECVIDEFSKRCYMPLRKLRVDKRLDDIRLGDKRRC